MSQFLSGEQVEQFFDLGYVMLKGLFSSSEVAEMSQSFDQLAELAKGLEGTQLHHGAQFVMSGERIDRIVWCGAAAPSLLDVGEDPRLLSPVSQLLGSEKMEQLICQAHYKMPGDKLEFQWHQDSENRYYGTPEWNDINGRGSFVQTAIAIDQMTEENGPLLFIPYSGKKGHLYLDQPGNQEKHVDKNSAEEILLQPGDVSFWGPYTIHSSQPNTSSSSRRIFINGYAFPGANQHVYPGEGAGRIVSVKHPSGEKV